MQIASIIRSYQLFSPVASTNYFMHKYICVFVCVCKCVCACSVRLGNNSTLNW